MRAHKRNWQIQRGYDIAKKWKKEGLQFSDMLME